MSLVFLYLFSKIVLSSAMMLSQRLLSHNTFTVNAGKSDAELSIKSIFEKYL